MTTTTFSASADGSISLPVRLAPARTLNVPWNKRALLSLVLALLFVVYFLAPHVGIIRPIFRLSVFYVILAPLASFFLAVTSLRQMLRSGASDIELFMSVSALVVTSLYFIVALATPIVLVGFYIVYVYLLR